MTYSNNPEAQAQAVNEQQQRAAALTELINSAPQIGIDAALANCGSALTDTEKELLRTLTPEELTALSSILSKLGAQIFPPMIIAPI